MGLTVFIDRVQPKVCVLQWFLNTRETMDYACGPLVTFQADEFRRNGFEFIRDHFERYKTIRVDRDAIVPAFVPSGEGRFMKNQRAVRMDEYPPGTVVLTPLEFKKLTLNGMFPMSEDSERTVLLGAKPSEFWTAFDEVLSATE